MCDAFVNLMFMASVHATPILFEWVSVSVNAGPSHMLAVAAGAADSRILDGVMLRSIQMYLAVFIICGSTSSTVLSKEVFFFITRPGPRGNGTDYVHYYNEKYHTATDIFKKHNNTTPIVHA